MTLFPPHASRRAPRAVSRLLAAALLFVAGSACAEDDDAAITRLESDVQRAYAEERYEDAFDMFTTLYALTRDPRDACNAGRTAFRLERMVSAVEFLSICEAMVREGGAQKLSVRDRGVVAGAMADLTVARERVGRLVVTVNKDGAAIALDGKAIGASPLAREIPVEPGQHRVRVTLGGASKEVSGAVKAGDVWPVRVILSDPSARAPLAGKAKPADGSALASSASDAHASPNKAFWRLPFFWVTVGVGVVGTGIATGAAIRWHDAWENAQRLDQDVDLNGGEEIGGRRAYRCVALADELGKVDSARRVTGVTLTATALLASAVLVTGIWVTEPWPWGTPKKTQIQAAPTLGGVVIRGTF